MSLPYSAATYRIGGQEYPIAVHRRCPVCTSSERGEIEIAIASGQPYASIADGLDPDLGIAADALVRHVRNDHMPLRQATLRKVVEARTTALNQAIETGADALVDDIVLCRSVVTRTFQRIAAGELEPTVADGLTAARLLRDAGVEDDQTDQGAYVEAFMVYMETAQASMTTEQFAAFCQRLDANPTLRALLARQRSSTEAV